MSPDDTDRGCEGDVAPLDLGHAFSDPTLLETALTHASLAQERDGSRGNERMEFLGDAVLDLVISRALYDVHPGWSEGTLTRARASLVNTGSLARRARAIGLGAHLRLGRSERKGRGGEKPSILANAFEATVAAVYLDGGLAAAETLVRKSFPEAWDPDAPPPQRDPKTRLNEWAVAELGAPLAYEGLVDHGEDAAEARFEVEVRLPDGAHKGRGPTRRDAERQAAAAALEAVGARDEGAGVR